MTTGIASNDWPNYATGHGVRGQGYLDRAIALGHEVHALGVGAGISHPVLDAQKALRILRSHRMIRLADRLAQVLRVGLPQ